MVHTELEKQMMKAINKLYEGRKFWFDVSSIEFLLILILVILWILK